LYCNCALSRAHHLQPACLRLTVAMRAVLHKAATRNGAPDPLFANSAFPEQQNRPIGDLKPLAAHMRTDTLLWLTPLKLYKQAKRQHATWLRR
jgi:hypothetical protein